jgi:PilZ domain
MEAVGINISEGGMGLFTVAHLPIGSRIEVEFRTAEGPASFMRFPATVRHRALYLYGVQFEHHEENESIEDEEEKTDTHPGYQA